MLTRSIVRRLGFVCLSALAIASTACDESLLGPGEFGSPTQFTREITLDELENLLATGAARVEIELVGEGLVAREIILESPEAIGEEEFIESRVTAIAAEGEAGSLTLAQGLAVDFDPETGFFVGEADMGFGDFVAQVEALLAEDVAIFVVASRDAPDAPQDPTDATFRANTLQLHDDETGTALGLNVDLDNLALNTSPHDGEPDGWINALGLAIELRVSDGVTGLGHEQTDVADVIEFEGVIASVNLENSSFTFEDGTQVFMLDDTEIGHGDLESLAGVKEALAAGQTVFAWGAGRLDSEDPPMIAAFEVHFGVEGGTGGGAIEFEGAVTSVDLELGKSTLTNGTILLIGEGTVFHDVAEGEALLSLEAVKGALDNSLSVIAYGFGEVESEEPLRIGVIEATFKVLQ